jgi:hypothetical protein
MEQKQEMMGQVPARQEKGGPARGFLIGLIAVAVIALILIVGLAVLRGGAGNLAEASNSLSGVFDSISESAEGIASSANIGGDQIVEPNRFLSVQKDMVLRPSDLETAYHIDTGQEKRLANTTLVQEMGQVAGKSYVSATGRVDGWYLQLRRTNSSSFGPATFTSTVEVFNTVDGALVAMSSEYHPLYNSTDRDYDVVEGGCNLGRNCTLFTSQKFDPASSLTTLRYDVLFTYQNVLVWVSGTGLDVELTPDMVIDAGEIVLNKLSQLELVSAD